MLDRWGMPWQEVGVEFRWGAPQPPGDAYVTERLMGELMQVLAKEMQPDRQYEIRIGRAEPDHTHFASYLAGPTEVAIYRFLLRAWFREVE